MNSAISIILPAFNESRRLGASIEEIIKYITDNQLQAELIIVDDGSTDSTAQVAEKSRGNFAALRVIRYAENRGKGFAVRTGLTAAKYDFALFSDADLSTPISETPKLIEPLERNELDVAFGSRALDRSLIGTHQPWRREQGGKVFNLIVKFFTGLPFWDTQCGFKAFRMKAFRPLLETMQIERFGFDVEFLYVAHLAGLRLREIPVRWNDCAGTKVNVLRDSRRMIAEVREIKRNAKRGVYDSAIQKAQSIAEMPAKTVAD